MTKEVSVLHQEHRGWKEISIKQHNDKIKQQMAQQHGKAVLAHSLLRPIKEGSLEIRPKTYIPFPTMPSFYARMHYATRHSPSHKRNITYQWDQLNTEVNVIHNSRIGRHPLVRLWPHYSLTRNLQAKLKHRSQYISLFSFRTGVLVPFPNILLSTLNYCSNGGQAKPLRTGKTSEILHENLVSTDID